LLSLLDSLPHTCTVKRRTRTVDAMGGSKDSWTTVSSSVSCWRQPLSDREMADYMSRGITVDTKFFFASDPSLDETHQLTVGSDVYTVRSVSSPDSGAGLGVVWRMVCKLEANQ